METNTQVNVYKGKWRRLENLASCNYDIGLWLKIYVASEVQAPYSGIEVHLKSGMSMTDVISEIRAGQDEKITELKESIDKLLKELEMHDADYEKNKYDNAMLKYSREMHNFREEQEQYEKCVNDANTYKVGLLNSNCKLAYSLLKRVNSVLRDWSDSLDSDAECIQKAKPDYTRDECYAKYLQDYEKARIDISNIIDAKREELAKLENVDLAETYINLCKEIDKAIEV